MPPDRRHMDANPSAVITTADGDVQVFDPGQDTDHSVAWVVQGPRDALTLLLPGLITVKSPVVRCLVQLVVVAQRRPKPHRR
jgi:hypothetical protein